MHFICEIAEKHTVVLATVGDTVYVVWQDESSNYYTATCVDEAVLDLFVEQGAGVDFQLP